jgi:anti-sigma B factor antagonist
VLFDVQRREREGWTVLAVIGELDLSVVPRVRQAALQWMPAGTAGADAPRVIVDLSSVDFIDSAGLGVVLGIVRRARQAGGHAAVVLDGDSSAGRVFATLGLDRVIAVASRVDDVVDGAVLGVRATQTGTRVASDERGPALIGEPGGHDG